MFTITQSNDTAHLAKILTQRYQQSQDDVFSSFLVITPAKVLEEWLKKTIAQNAKISTLLTTKFWGQYQWQLIGEILAIKKTYLTQLGQGEQALSVPEVAVLSQSVVHWRIFDYLIKPIWQGGDDVNAFGDFGHLPSHQANDQPYQQSNPSNYQPNHQAGKSPISLAKHIYDNPKHELHFLIAPLADKVGNIDNQKLWRLCQELASLYVKYLTQRPAWLDSWAKPSKTKINAQNGQIEQKERTAQNFVNVKALIAEKDRFAKQLNQTNLFQALLPHSSNPSDPSDEQASIEKSIDTSDDVGTPEWLIAHYEMVETALFWFWNVLFSDVYVYRQSLEREFWAILVDAFQNPDSPIAPQVKNALPKNLYLFTVQQLPSVELDFLKQLSRYVDIELLHFNPSQMYWADIVDKRWFENQRLTNPMMVYAKDYGQGLLSRLGKSARETFAMLTSLSGGEDYGQDRVKWDDRFVAVSSTPSLLNALKSDILNLEEYQVARRLNQRFLSSDGLAVQAIDDSLQVHNCYGIKRQLEIVRLKIGKWLNEQGADGTPRQLSDIAILSPDIESHYTLIRSAFGEQVGLDGLVLPAKMTGVPNLAVAQLWQGIVGFYELPAGRFYADELFSWFSLPAVYENFGLDFDEMSRACELLVLAGFVRGLDGRHLSESLDKADKDFRHSFANALDVLVLSLSFAKQKTVVGALYPFEFKQNNEQLWLDEPTAVGEKTPLLPQVGVDDEPIIATLCRLYAGFNECRALYHQVDDVLKWLDGIERQMIDRYFFVSRHSESMRAIFEAKNQLKQSIIANNHYYKYANTPKSSHDTPVRLPLSLVIDSLGEQVLAQQIASEPSGVINVGRFGSFRGIPFKLVIMLDMNLLAFPRKEKDSRLDLIKAGKPKLGDRQSEDDDNGVFLEAILSAQEACWIFYEGQSADGNKLPATCVDELINFVMDSVDNPTQKQAVQDIFHQKHPALPFDPSLFYASDNQPLPEVPPAPIWQSVHQATHLGKTKPIKYTLPSEAFLRQLQKTLDDIALGVVDTAVKTVIAQGDIGSPDGIVSALKNPAKVHLSEYLAVFVSPKQSDENERLALDSLEQFLLSQSVLATDDKTQMGQLYFENLHHLPFGVGRFGVLKKAKDEMISLTQALKSVFAQKNFAFDIVLPQTRQIPITAEFGMLASVPDQVPVWGNVRPSRGKPYHLLTAYLSHLAWQAVLADDKKVPSAFGVSIWHFVEDNKGNATYLFEPIPQTLAKQELLKMWYFASVIKQTPILIDATIAFDYAHQYQDDKFKWESILAKWRKDGFATKYDGLNDEHWAYLLQGYDDDHIFDELKKTLTIIAPSLFHHFIHRLVVV